MRIFRFAINEDIYKQFTSICDQEEITIKKKLNVLLAQDKTSESGINQYLQDKDDFDLRMITLKVNEELYKGIMKNSDILAVNPKNYIPYLINKFMKLQ